MEEKLPFTEEELKKYIDDTYSWANEHPKTLMHFVSKWVIHKFIITQQALLTLYRMLDAEKEHLNYLNQKKFKNLENTKTFIDNSIKRIDLLDKQIINYEEYLDKLI